MIDKEREHHLDHGPENEELLKQLIESLLNRFKDRFQTEEEREEVLRLLRLTLEKM